MPPSLYPIFDFTKFTTSNVPLRTIQDLERRDDGRVSTCIKLADALGLTLDELCRDRKEERRAVD